MILLVKPPSRATILTPRREDIAGEHVSRCPRVLDDSPICRRGCFESSGFALFVGLRRNERRWLSSVAICRCSLAILVYARGYLPVVMVLIMVIVSNVWTNGFCRNSVLDIRALSVLIVRAAKPCIAWSCFGYIRARIFYHTLTCL